jgi:hypothetical protein
MICRQCRQSEATVAIRSGFEFHPTCAECAEWWALERRYPIENVEPDYQYEGDDGG